MNQHAVEVLATELAGQMGIDAVALVDGGSGLVWHTTGRAQPQSALWEAAVDYWRLYRRMGAHFDQLGDLRAAVLYHRHRMLCVLPLDAQSDLLVVCVAEHRAVDWVSWQRRLRELSDSAA